MNIELKRDVPLCPALAIADLQQQLKNIFALKGEKMFFLKLNSQFFNLN